MNPLQTSEHLGNISEKITSNKNNDILNELKLELVSSKDSNSPNSVSSKYSIYFDQQCDCYVIKDIVDVGSIRERIYEYYNNPENLETEEKFQLWKELTETKIEMVGMSKLQLKKEDSEIHRINISIHGNLARISTLQDFNKFKILQDRYNKNSMIDLDYRSGASQKLNNNYANSSQLIRSKAQPSQGTVSTRNVNNNTNAVQFNTPTVFNNFTKQEPVLGHADDHQNQYTSSGHSMKILSKGKLNPIRAEQNTVNLADYTSAYQSQVPQNITRRVEKNHITREPANAEYLQLKAEHDRLLAELEDVSIKKAILSKTNESQICNNNIHLKKMGEMSSEINRLYQRCRDLENQQYNNDDNEKLVIHQKDIIAKKDQEITKVLSENSNEVSRLKHNLSFKDSELLKMNDFVIRISSLENTITNKDLEVRSVRDGYELQLTQYKSQLVKMRGDFDQNHQRAGFQDKIVSLESDYELLKNDKFNVEVERDTLKERLAAKEKEQSRKTNDSLQQVHHQTIELSRQDELIETGINDAMNSERTEFTRKRDSLKSKIRNLLQEFHKFSDKESEYRALEQDNRRFRLQLESMTQKFRIYKNYITNIQNTSDVLARIESNLMSDVILLRDKFTNPPDLNEEHEVAFDYYDVTSSATQNLAVQYDNNFFETNQNQTVGFESSFQNNHNNFKKENNYNSGGISNYKYGLAQIRYVFLYKF